ncbi:MAG: DAK2 domain-containing protein [Clostridia bacterium]|nr:DAK2 domain-containing protein [Clostridia bacterium]
MVLTAAAYLEKNKKAIDALNVFPVPDGDTGINMSLTMHMAAREAQQHPGETVQQVADAIAMGSLKGARGNSGVILSQIFRGFAKGLAGVTEMRGSDLARAMEMASEAAYKAVMKPKEGTILTVVRMMAQAAGEAAEQQGDALEVLDAILREGEITLNKTPDMLPVLKESGVVDSGGAGLLVVFRGFKMYLEGEEVPDVDVSMFAPANIEMIDDEELGNLEFRYCTEFFIKDKAGQLSERDAERLRGMLEKIGDCVLVVGGGELLKVHFHSNSPGKGLQYGLRFGELSHVKIDNMGEQHRSLDEDISALMPEQPKAPRKAQGFVTVAAGAGLSEVFKSLNADVIIEGGQSMNPSIEDIGKAIEETNADCVFVLPNNKNIVMAAQQAASLCEDKRVEVLRTVSIPQGIGAAIAFDPEASPENNIEAMTESMENVHSCLITYAVRDTQLNGQEISEGDILGIYDGDLRLAGKEIDAVVLEMLEQIVQDTHDTISMFYGADVQEEDAQLLSEKIEQAFPDCEVQVYDGGQPLYYYIFGIE